MARSIHTTRRTISALVNAKFASEEDREEALEAALREQQRKRNIKRSVLSERHRVDPPLAGTAIESIEIEVLDESEFVHFPASADEIRKLLSLMPQAATEGITRIQLSLGKEYMDEASREEPVDERDPHTGRPGFEFLPSIYYGQVHGTYTWKSRLIKLFAFVYRVSDLRKLPVPTGALELFLRLQFLKTLVHELAHHHDGANRIKRGRWLADRTDNVENYAERMEYTWTRDYVHPFLEKEYPAEVAELLRWVEEWGGARLSLEFFAGDPRCTLRNGLKRLIWSTEDAFISLVRTLHESPTPMSLTESRFSFAWDVHFCDEYDLCLQIVNALLAERPDDVDSLVCKADTLIHLDKLEEAWDLTARVLDIDPRHEAAWELQASILEDRKHWEPLLQHCEKWHATAKADSKNHYRFIYPAIACCALDRAQEMEEWIQKILVLRPRSEKFLRRRILRGAGKEEPNR